MTQIELILSEEELSAGGQIGQAAWISKGLKLEEAQCVIQINTCNGSPNAGQRFELRSHSRKLGKRPTTAQKLELAKKRRGLRTRITSFTKTALQYLGEDALEAIYETEGLVVDEDLSQDEDDKNDEVNPTISAADPEHQILPLPSAVPDDCIGDLPPERWSVIADLRETELQIREGHGADAMDKIRTAVIHLSWQFKNKVRRATSGVQTKRAWDKIKLLNLTCKLQRRVYNHNRLVMMNIGDSTVVSEKYPFLDLKDCTVNTTVTNRTSAGQSCENPPWILGSSTCGKGPAANDAEHENECKVPASPHIN